jgi:hypothetical protein
VVNFEHENQLVLRPIKCSHTGISLVQIQNAVGGVKDTLKGK